MRGTKRRFQIDPHWTGNLPTLGILMIPLVAEVHELFVTLHSPELSGIGWDVEEIINVLSYYDGMTNIVRIYLCTVEPIFDHLKYAKSIH
jgi:hypothetical protein